MTLFGITHSQQPANMYAGSSPGLPEPEDNERYWTSKIADATISELRAMGHLVVVGPRNTASYENNKAFYNAHPEIALGHEIHTNATGVSGAMRTGAAVGYVSPKGKLAAESITRQMIAMRFPGSCYVTDTIRVAVMFTKPVVTLGEYGFHDNPVQADFIRMHYADIGHYIALGMHNYAPGDASPITYPVPMPTPTTAKSWIPNPRLVTDGIKGPNFWRALQRVCREKYSLGTTVDGTVGPETYLHMKRAFNARNGTKYEPSRFPLNEAWIKLFQTMLGVKADGLWGKDTTRAMQVFLNNGTF